MNDRPITVAVISDSHVRRLADLPEGLVYQLTRADAIIHLGDYTSPELLNDLRKLGNFYGIIGNHDSTIGHKELKVIEVIELGGKKLGLIHGFFLPMARPKRMRLWFQKYKNVDMLLFGHNHLYRDQTIAGVHLFNPGTVTGQFPAVQATFGLLTLNGTISSKIITLDYPIPYRNKLILRLLAIIIRNGIRFLEAWPYFDLSSWTRNIRAKLPGFIPFSPSKRHQQKGE